MWRPPGRDGGERVDADMMRRPCGRSTDSGRPEATGIGADARSARGVERAPWRRV